MISCKALIIKLIVCLVGGGGSAAPFVLPDFAPCPETPGVSFTWVVVFVPGTDNKTWRSAINNHFVKLILDFASVPYHFFKCMRLLKIMLIKQELNYETISYKK